ncbi:MAG: putative sulfonate transport system ATP-binding protein [Planctomycetota bacterium]|jgi:NitT/TauT family transport system ATP-binding protein
MPSATDAQHLALRGASRSFGSVRAVDRVSLSFARGSFTALVGPSGCGKTTILRLLGGLDAPDAGSCERETGGVLSTGFLFQEPRLLAWRTVRENVALPLELAGIAAPERLARADEALRLVRLADAGTRFPHQLSGGMKMRASLARAIIARPALLLLDEPFGALDEVTRHELDMELRALWERERFTAILVTHSLPEAAFLAERMIVFSPRPAQVVAEIATPAGARDARFWTGDALGACVRAGSEAMLRAIEEARR